MKILRNWWFVTVTAAVLLALVLAVGLPLFVAALRPLWVRLSLVLLVAAVWGLFAFLRVAKAKKAAAALAAELAGPNAADEEGRALAQRMGAALGQLKTASGKRRDYLYTRPWYVIIGPPGAGKTTALVNSGLQFPFSEQSVKGVGGTRHLDFWFADQAVLVDTAGRYTTQDSERAVDSAGWQSFLSLLKKHRPLQPVNGILVAIGVDELIRSDTAGIDAHARAVRRRLVELRRTLEVAAPIYVILTKADLLAGFTQYFDDLDVEGRRAVLGSTLDYKGGKPSGETLARAFDEMAQSVADRQAKRIFDEVDPYRRGLMLGFPSQIQSLRARLMRFLDGAFVTGDEPTGSLRGFYLTSGVQEGAPLDRILSGMAEVYDRPEGGRAGAGGSGRAYFLNRLLGEVMFPEAGLVTMDPRARARQRSQLIGGVAAIAAVALLTIGLWGVSFASNRSYQAELDARTQAAATALKDAGVDLVQVRDGDADLRAALPGLNQLRDLPGGYAERAAGGPPLLSTFGLYQRGLSRQAEETYREALRRVVLPRLLLRLEQYMQGVGSDPTRLYEPLKVYLMLGQHGQAPMDKPTVRAWVTSDWANEVYPGADSEPERKQLTQHLNALLDDQDLPSVWPERRAPLDGQLVASARQAIQTLSLADRAYAIMRQKAASAGGGWQAGAVLSAGDAAAFANPEAVLGQRVPYFYTKAGFEKAYTLGLATVQEDLRKDLWVLGEDAQKGGVRAEMQNIRPGVAALYAKDYIAAWERVLQALQPADYFNNPAAFGAITKTPSPLKQIMLELRKNTTFGGGAQAALAKKYGATKLGKAAGALAGAAGGGVSAADEITGYFAAVHDYVGDGKAPAPVDEFVAALKGAGQAVLAAKAIGGGGGSDATQAQLATAVASVRAAAAGAPPQLQGFVQAAAGGGSQAQIGAASGAVNEVYAQNVLPACREVAQDRYPFFGAATQDASPAETQRVFGMGGIIDQFAGGNLKALLEKEGPVWRWKLDDPIAATLDPSSPEQFGKAAEIRDMLAGGLPIRVSLAQLGSQVGSVEIASGGTTYKLDGNTAQPRPLIWSLSGALPAASLVLYGSAPGPDGKLPELKRIETSGPWALFRLIDEAETQNAGTTAIRATWGEGAASATLLINLPSDRNPFSRGGVWSFRCPSTL